MQLKNVSEFEYLCSLITWNGDGDSRKVWEGICSIGLNRLWDAGDVSRVGTKLQLLRVCIFRVLLYASETWTLKKEDGRRLRAFEMKCCKRLLDVKWFHFGTNNEIKKRVHLTDNVLTTIKRRKARLFGQKFRMNDDRLLKVMMLGFGPWEQ